MTALTLLTEGAILDWGALLLSGKGLVPTAQAGLAYSMFAIAMTFGRLTGDAVARSALRRRRHGGDEKTRACTMHAQAQIGMQFSLQP